MVHQWQRWRAAMLPDGGDPAVAALAERLQAAAPALAARLNVLGAASGRTILHGDFKTANIFFQPGRPGAGAAVRACPCDFQWAGAGVCMQDVAYLLWTSVDPATAAAHEADLLEHYRQLLRRELAEAGVKRTPSDCELQEQYEANPPPPPFFPCPCHACPAAAAPAATEARA